MCAADSTAIGWDPIDSTPQTELWRAAFCTNGHTLGANSLFRRVQQIVHSVFIQFPERTCGITEYVEPKVGCGGDFNHPPLGYEPSTYSLIWRNLTPFLGWK